MTLCHVLCAGSDAVLVLIRKNFDFSVGDVAGNVQDLKKISGRRSRCTRPHSRLRLMLGAGAATIHRTLWTFSIRPLRVFIPSQNPVHTKSISLLQQKRSVNKHMRLLQAGELRWKMDGP